MSGPVELTLRIRLSEAPTNIDGTPMSIDSFGEWAAETIADGLLVESGRYLGGSMSKAEPPPRVSIRAHTYRGKDGYLVAGGRSRIFAPTRASAERLRERIRNGEDDRAEDYRL